MCRFRGSILYIIFLISLISHANCQTKEDSLRLKASQVASEIDSLNKLLVSLETQVSQIVKDRNVDAYSEGDFTDRALVILNGKLKDSSYVFAEEIIELRIGDTLSVFGYKDGYWLVRFNDIVGYISNIHLDSTDDMIVYKTFADSISEEFREKELALKKERDKSRRLEIQSTKASEVELENETRRQQVLTTYGDQVGNKLLKSELWIGMTYEMALISAGKPRKINTTVTSFGSSEQWVYVGMYLYFNDGILTSFQTER